MPKNTDALSTKLNPQKIRAKLIAKTTAPIIEYKIDFFARTVLVCFASGLDLISLYATLMSLSNI